MMAMLSQHDDNAILPPPQGDDAVIDMQWRCHNYAMTNSYTVSYARQALIRKNHAAVMPCKSQYSDKRENIL